MEKINRRVTAKPHPRSKPLDRGEMETTKATLTDGLGRGCRLLGLASLDDHRCGVLLALIVSVTAATFLDFVGLLSHSSVLL